ncbi:hypothetical protein CEXT_628301 [Caerostris extrusa]|uniref:Uncharacterized protein n=1 Tax=Caerostris extrusa TaxID=172846 RepID=A0AAV4Y4Q1_CAEEX|nr:hypothetical protein CEXT_628301 [Caerostris extrusa]
MMKSERFGNWMTQGVNLGVYGDDHVIEQVGGGTHHGRWPDDGDDQEYSCVRQQRMWAFYGVHDGDVSENKHKKFNDINL